MANNYPSFMAGMGIIGRMAAITMPVVNEAPQLRPLNILRDLPNVADLIEKCFASTMDSEGRSYLQQMRRAGRDNSFLRWASNAVETAAMPLSGYVWEESGQIIGNVSLIPHRSKHKRIYLIANVATHPDHRRRGIGRALTLAAVHHAQARRASEIWLHVRDDNPGAISLYDQLGFAEIARRTTWMGRPDRHASAPRGAFIARRHTRDWPLQKAWLEQVYPEFMSWYQPMPWNMLQPGLAASLYRFLLDYNVRHWSARAGGSPIAFLSWQAVNGQNDRLWAAIPERVNETILTALLTQARIELAWRQGLTLDFPAGQFIQAFEQAGFHPHRTLLWMKLMDASHVHDS
jgi:ribosomal protein S18 acetylase RimI-like enzyme